MAKTAQQPVLVIMGVSGSGKSTVAGLLAGRLGWDLAEGDDLHPASNVAKMQAGEPLTDEDRWPWLESIAEWIRAHTQDGTPGVVTCSALKKRYRDALRGEGVVFVFLQGSKEKISDRLASRHGHFMPPRCSNRSLMRWKSRRRTKSTFPCAYRPRRRKKPRKSSSGSTWARQTPRPHKPALRT
jgi:gluconokinase